MNIHNDPINPNAPATMMTASSVPPSPLSINTEEARLAAVKSLEILDSQPEPEFEAIARVAARLFGTPMAVVSLMDADRQWFKARLGIGPAQVPRSDSLCALTLAQTAKHHQPLVISDLWQDPRTANNPHVTGPTQWRFYAGAPMFDALGHGLGTVAVMDVEPRAFNMSQRHALSDLAQIALKAIEGRLSALTLAKHGYPDPLTGLSSRSHFDLALDLELRRAMRTGEPFTVLSLTLDGLDAVLDGFGASACEELLIQVSQRLKQQVRLGDVIARLDVNEFAVVMRQGDSSAADMLVSRIASTVKEPILLSSGDSVGVGISVGVAAYDDSVESTAALLSRAQDALRQAQQQNEKRWGFLRKLKEGPELRLIR
jgi:diguanylate cyclase (GGDEF)-like protein